MKIFSLALKTNDMQLANALIDRKVHHIITIKFKNFSFSVRVRVFLLELTPLVKHCACRLKIKLEIKPRQRRYS